MGAQGPNPLSDRDRNVRIWNIGLTALRAAEAVAVFVALAAIDHLGPGDVPPGARSTPALAWQIYGGSLSSDGWRNVPSGRIVGLLRRARSERRRQCAARQASRTARIAIISNGA